MSFGPTITYNIQTDFPNSKVDAALLSEEINESTIQTSLDYIQTGDNLCDIVFVAEISDSEKITLDDIVSKHVGEKEEIIVIAQVAATGSVTTTATQYAPIPDMSFVPNSALGDGDYRISFSATAGHDSGGEQIYFACFISGSIIDFSERIFGTTVLAGGTTATTSFIIRVAMSASSPIEAKWRTTDGTASVAARALLVEKVV